MDYVGPFWNMHHVLATLRTGHWSACGAGGVARGAPPELTPRIFSALRWLHERYIAHCDISMENILVTKELGWFPKSGGFSVS